MPAPRAKMCGERIREKRIRPPQPKEQDGEKPGWAARFRAAMKAKKKG